jgi:hypothetical protein
MHAIMTIARLDAMSLPDYVTSILYECRDACADDTCDIGHLVNWDKVRAESREKPRIAITAEITRRGNLSIKWSPIDGSGRFGWYSDQSTSDFNKFQFEGATSWGDRPEEEITFIRDVKKVNYDDGEMGELLKSLVTETVNTVLRRVGRSYDITRTFKLVRDKDNRLIIDRLD